MLISAISELRGGKFEGHRFVPLEGAPWPRGTEVVVLPQGELDALVEEAQKDALDARVGGQAVSETFLAKDKAAEEECPHNGATWCVGTTGGCWEWLAPGKGRCAAGANAPCPHNCGATLPPKPAQYMSAEEWAEECPLVWIVRRPSKYCYSVRDELGESRGYGATHKEAWRAAGTKLREEAAPAPTPVGAMTPEECTDEAHRRDYAGFYHVQSRYNSTTSKVEYRVFYQHFRRDPWEPVCPGWFADHAAAWHGALTKIREQA